MELIIESNSVSGDEFLNYLKERFDCYVKHGTENTSTKIIVKEKINK